MEQHDEILNNESLDDFAKRINNFIDNCWSSVLKNNELTPDLKKQLPYFINKINHEINVNKFNPSFVRGYLSFLIYFKKLNFTNNIKMWKNWITFRYVEL